MTAARRGSARSSASVRGCNQGTKTWADGGKYVGQFKDDKRHGRGKYTLANGKVDHDGEWVNGDPKK